MSDERRIKELAYQIWESEGRPSGHDSRHWEMARKLAEAEKGGKKATVSRARKPKAAALSEVPTDATKKPKAAAKPRASKAKAADEAPAKTTASAAAPAEDSAAKPAKPAAAKKPAASKASGTTAKPKAPSKPKGDLKKIDAKG